MSDNEGIRRAPLSLDVRGCPVFNWQLTPTDRRDPIVCRLPPSSLTYCIYSSGLIERLTPFGFDQQASSGLIKYVYFSSTGFRHELGTHQYRRVQRRAVGGVLAVGHVRLVDLNQVKNYAHGHARFGFENDSSRPFINDVALASLLGAMLDVGYTDISCNGFSHADGTSAPSKSHVNGVNGDFKYLRADGTTQEEPSLHIDTRADLMDEVRQNAFHDALYKFGWKSILSWRYTRSGVSRLLAHATHFANHHHHIHVQGYSPNVVDK